MDNYMKNMLKTIYKYLFSDKSSITYDDFVWILGTIIDNNPRIIFGEELLNKYYTKILNDTNYSTNINIWLSEINKLDIKVRNNTNG